MAFSKNRRLADLVTATGEVSSFVDASVTHADLHTSMDLTGKTVTVANASTGDNDTTAANTAFVQQEIAALVDSAPGTLNTLNELAAALGDDANYSTTTTAAIAAKLPLAGGTLTGDIATSGSIIFDNNVQAIKIKDAAGTAGYVFYQDNGDTLVVGNGTTVEKVRLDTSGNEGALIVDTNGNVGIDETTPLAKLHVVGGRTNGTVYNTIIAAGGVNSTDGSGARLILSGCENDPLARGTVIEGISTGTGNSHQLNFKTNNGSNTPSTRMTIGHTGNVGIGDTNPQHPLKVHLTNGEIAMFGSNGMNSPGQYAGIGLGQVLANATSHQKIKLVGEGRNSGSYVSDFHILVDTASDSGDAVLADSKFEIDGGTGAINMSSQPSALIYNGSSHTQAGGAAQYTFPTTAYNVGGCYNVNNGRFTVTTPGKYLVTCQLGLNASTAAQTYLAMGPRLNDTGTVFFGGWSVKTTAANQYGAHTQSIVMDLQANDFLVFYIELSATAVVLGGPHYTAVSVHKLS